MDPLPERIGGLSLTSAQKAAIVLLSMEKEEADKLLKHFDEDDLKALAATIAELGRIPDQSIGRIVEEFVAALKGPTFLEGSLGEAQSLLSGALEPDKLSELVADIRGDSTQKVWQILPSIGEEQIVTFISTEHPQVAAFMVSRMPSELVAKIMELLSESLRLSIVQRIVTLVAVKRAPLKLLEEVILTELIEKLAASDNSKTYRKIAAVLNQMSPTNAESIVLGLSETQPNDALQIKALLFKFGDIPALSPADRAKLFEQVPADLIPLSLNGVEEALVESVKSSLSARSRRIVEAEMGMLPDEVGPETQDAQRKIANIALELAEGGAISLSTEDDNA